MSLINDALKKAQKQRTGDSPPLASLPSVGGESPARIAKRDKPAGINTQLVRMGVAGGALALVLVVGGIFLIRSFRAAPVAKLPPPTTPVAATVHTEPPVEPAHAPEVKSPLVAPKPGDGGSAEPTVSFRLPAAPPVDREPVTAAPAAAPAATSAERAASSPETGREIAKAMPSEPAAPSSPPPTMDAKALNFIDNLRIAGIRAAGSDSKVLMNDRVYRIGDTVDRDMGLKLTGITANSLTFVDPNGASYTRQF
ncbi:MAG TPA: hypothetical protein VG936_04380 [Lacunisphaera sp.]|nr:hypothetical protein [Lacunisphaera sp.]